MKGSKGYRRGTRGFKVKTRERGRIRIKKYMREFKEADRVSIVIDPSFQNIPHPRFQGRSGRILGKQGRSYFVSIRDGRKEKKILVNPEHLTALE